MNNLEEKLYKSLAPDFVPEDSLNAFILKKAMEMEKIRHKPLKISIAAIIAVVILIIYIVKGRFI